MEKHIIGAKKLHVPRKTMKHISHVSHPQAEAVYERDQVANANRGRRPYNKINKILNHSTLFFCISLERDE